MTYVHDLVFYETITPLHVGCGQDVGVVDLLVIRERTTGYPYIPGSGIRGACRSAFDPSVLETRFLFGPEAEEWDKNETRYAGCVAFHDAKVLLFPVRSDQGPFLWLTSPGVIRRLERELVAFQGSARSLAWWAGAEPDDDHVVTPAGIDQKRVFLEEFGLDTTPTGRDELAAWGQQVGLKLGLPDLSTRLCLVSDQVFTHFVRFATLIQQHNKLNSAKTVEDGQLFSLEAVPPEAVFYGFVGGTKSRWTEKARAEPMKSNEVLQSLRKGLQVDADGVQLLHLGGHESTGLGVTRLNWSTAAGGRKG